MTLLIFTSKTTGETAPYEFNFNDKLQFGETISGASVSATVFSGIDATPAALILGTPTIVGGVVTQNIQGGVPGVIYLLSCVVAASNAHNYTKEGRLAVISPGGRYVAL